MVFPTTPLPAAKVGEDDTVALNGVPVPTFGAFIRNLCPGSAAGIPGLTLPAGMTKAGLPVGITLDGPENSEPPTPGNRARARDPAAKVAGAEAAGTAHWVSLAPAAQAGYGWTC